MGEKRDWRRRRGASFVSFVVFVVRDSVRSGNENALPRGQGGCLLAAYDPVALPADLRDNNGAGDRNREGHGTDMVAGVGERSNVRGFAVARAVAAAPRTLRCVERVHRCHALRVPHNGRRPCGLSPPAVGKARGRQ